MNRSATLVAVAAIGPTTCICAFALEGPSHQSAGMNREAVIRTATNIFGGPVTYPTDTTEVTTQMVTFRRARRLRRTEARLLNT